MNNHILVVKSNHQMSFPSVEAFKVYRDEFIKHFGDDSLGKYEVYAVSYEKLSV